jgi:hypothetical protein
MEKRSLRNCAEDFNSATSGRRGTRALASPTSKESEGRQDSQRGRPGIALHKPDARQ